MSNSSLVTYTRLTKHTYGARNHAVDRITPHCFVGQVTGKRGADYFADTDRSASSNYIVGHDGSVGLSVEEKNAAMTSSNQANDERAITIECASGTSEPYAFTDACYNKLIELCVDICRRYGKKKLIWISDKAKALAYNPASDEMLLTVHRWFANKACPGEWLYSRLGDLADKVTARLGGNSGDNESVLYRVQCGAFSQKVNADNMLNNIKKKGIEAFVVKVGSLYKVQVGAYSKRENAEAQLSKIRSLGFDGFITTESGKQVSTEPTKKTNKEIAKEIFNGTCSDSRWSTWGAGEVRKERLKLAGYNPEAVQKEVNKLF